IFVNLVCCFVSRGLFIWFTHAVRLDAVIGRRDPTHRTNYRLFRRSLMGGVTDPSRFCLSTRHLILFRLVYGRTIDPAQDRDPSMERATPPAKAPLLADSMKVFFVVSVPFVSILSYVRNTRVQGSFEV
ncbi:unnamed protein product, partial [Scytosiphon promiscuus]